MNREAGIVEKLLTSYGFIQCCERQARLFFHYSQYSGRVEHLKLGDPVEFEMTYDRKTGKPIASSVVRISSGAIYDEQLSQDRVSGIITLEVTPEQEGRVVYENRGECFFLPFSECDVESPSKLLAKDQVTFHISTDKSGNLRAKCLRPGTTTPSVFRGVVCTLKDRFGFIKRSDCDKEIFFHSSGCNNKIFNELNQNDYVEFDIQTRNGKEVAVNVNRVSASVQLDNLPIQVSNGLIPNDILTRTIENCGIISNISVSNLSNNNLINGINSNSSNNNLISGINSNLSNLFENFGNNSLISNSLLSSNSPPKQQQISSWFSKQLDVKAEDDYPLIDLNADAPYVSSQRTTMKCDSWSEILTHMPIDLNMQQDNAMQYRCFNKQYEEQRGRRVVLVRQPRGPDAHSKFETMRSA